MAAAIARFAAGSVAIVAQVSAARRGSRAPVARRARRANSRGAPSVTSSTTARSASKFCATAAARRSSWARSGAAASIDLIRRPLDPLQARGHFFYVSEDGEAPWSIGFEPARRAGDYRIEEPGFNRLAIIHIAERDRGADGDRARRRASCGPELADTADEQVGPAATTAADQLLRDRRPRNRGLRARPRFRRHACRDRVRPGAQRHPRPQPAPALGRGPTAARRRFSR